MRKLVSTMLIVCGLSGSLWAESIKVFAASSAKLAMSEIANEFKKSNPNDEIVLTFSATGKAYAQLSNGFEYDIFMAADSKHPAKIVADGLAISTPEVYALGVVALYSNDKELVKLGMDALKSDKVRHISIANPKVAPYGVAAMEILTNYGLKDVVASKIVMGDNIAQSVQFVDSGAAEVGLVAYSLLKETQPKGEYLVIDKSKFAPMEQSFVITKYAKGKSLATKFTSFITSKNAKAIFKKYGFETK
ncbi:MAG: molybdate ABC transporter substrate-binding protein [Epsilonproteobacteria bacterium]|nr:molybdate ABC transporter substrate-binding protein [Campylobacterota bacterium]